MILNLLENQIELVTCWKILNKIQKVINKNEKNLNFDYDEENDILLLSSEGDYKGTVEIYGLLVDFNKDFSVKGFEILLATKFFSNFLEKEVTKKMLKEVKSVKLEVRFSKEVMWSYLDFDLNNEHVRMPFTMSNPNYSYA